MSRFIAWLEDVDPASAIAIAGAKMGRLTELARIGMKVPRGFTITVDAYAYQCAESGLDAVIDEHLSTITAPVDRERLTAVADTIRTAFEHTPVQPKLATAIGDAYADLAFRCLDVGQPVAVRSSATGEDSAQASFAGIFDTYLGVSGETQVLDAVRRCWASLFSARALSYRLEHGRSHHDMPMAVGVLELIPARVSGVAFSLHPVSGKRDRMVIEGTWGWGEAVVQGVVTPDHVEVGKGDRRVLAYYVADKRVVSTFDYARGGVVQTDMPDRFRAARVLDEEEIAAIANAVCAIEDHFGYPVDVEWVIERTRRAGEPVVIVQTRPVTAATGPGVAAIGESGATWDPSVYAAKYAFGGPP
ncbi:PEP/pyruvate-binding domain-containing protein [Mycobacterium sp. SM1]|uniref:PEP/pyruvate-binding domain-containing protein n=1 Tax=Mycobacterium sp. SM1 TaxID=2816243 RepID=UPI001BD0DAE0|nr:PEP/pyruvate-binding domain-containing protein [Mycobacterium sp. SM1]MBS4730362.1 PEP/pyruvate-binding domain-containing protein [Mycobacterium sp. SM1]